MNNSQEYWENKCSYIKHHYSLAEMHLDEILSDIADPEKRKMHAHKMSFRKNLFDKAIKADTLTTSTNHE